MISADELLENAPRSARQNYEKNSRMRKPAGLINGQRKCAVSDYRLGLCRMSHNGCGAIAIYNALLSAGHKPDISVIALGIECYALRLGGILGTDCRKAEELFRKCRIPAVKTSDYDDFVKVMGAVRVGILCYWVAKPKRSLLHYAAIVNNGSGFDVCNRFSNRRTPSKVRSIGEFCPKESFVCGFFIS